MRRLETIEQAEQAMERGLYGRNLCHGSEVSVSPSPNPPTEAEVMEAIEDFVRCGGVVTVQPAEVAPALEPVRVADDEETARLMVIAGMF